MEAEPTPKKRGRPPGSRNLAPLTAILTPPSFEAGGEYKHADLETMISKVLSLLDWAIGATRNELMRGYQGKGLSIQVEDIEKLSQLALALTRAVDSLKKSSDLAEELASRMSPEQLLEAAIKKLEGQDLKTLRAAIRRLRQYVEKVGGPQHGRDKVEMGEVTAHGAIIALGEEP